jgi:hypothetical protein
MWGLGIVGTVLVAFAGPSPRLGAQTEGASYARIAVLQPHDGDTVDFEAGYVRHLAWHKQADDRWVWYGWTVTFGDRQRWFVYATFGHAAADFDDVVSPAEDERDNIANVTPHARFVGNALYEYLPAVSRGKGVPHPTARLELMSVDLQPGSTKAFETALAASQPTLSAETLWYRRVAGGTLPHYVRLRPRSTLKAVLDRENDQPIPDVVHGLIANITVEILTLRPAMSLGLEMERE